MPTDPAPFLSTIILTSAGMVAIVGGLLVARFVGLDSDQRGSRKVMGEASDRLAAARQRAQTAHANLLDWHAGDFFSVSVLSEIGDGTTDVSTLMRFRRAAGGDRPFALGCRAVGQTASRAVGAKWERRCAAE